MNSPPYAITIPELRSVAFDKCIEIHGPRSELAALFEPGFANRDGNATTLFFAPDYFLEIGGDSTSARQFSSDQQIRVDVSGKWIGYAVTGLQADRVLGACVNANQVLHRRQCAAVRLLDCPAVIAQLPDELLILVLASYAQSFEDAIRSATGRGQT